MADMSSSVLSVVGKSNLAADESRKAADAANRGRDAVARTVAKMESIQNVVADSAKVIESLGKRSEEIGEIVDVITNISDQTNLLALNAAIEAARAGEQGRGFAVVAEEVKNLAEDSREAAERIAKMIKEVQTETGKAVESMQLGTKETAEGKQIVDQTGKAFQDIATAAASTAEEVKSISALMEKQKEGTQRAAKAVDGIASVAEETASASEESAASTEELTASMEDMTARAQALSEMAINLQKTSSRFKTQDEGVAKAADKKPTPVKEVEKPRSPPAKKPGDKTPEKIPPKVREALSKRGIDVGKE
jgi:methyl-accepting chemotaxis protein